MDLASLIMAAAGGAVGGAFGGLIAWAIKRFAPNINAAVVSGVAAGGAVLGYAVLTPIFERTVGPQIRETTGTPAELRNIGEQLKQQPLFAALMEKQPELEEDFNQAMAEAYREGGVGAVETAAVLWSAERVTSLMVEYVPYARDEDLRAWARGTSDMLDRFAEESSFICHDFLFGPQTGHPLVPSDMSPELSELSYNFGNEIVAPVFSNADMTAPQTPTDADQAAFVEIAVGFVTELGPDRTSYAQGVRPPTAEDSQIVCAATANLYDAVAQHERAGSIVRLMLSGI